MTKLERKAVGSSIVKSANFYEVQLHFRHAGTSGGTFDYEGLRECAVTILVPREFGDGKTFDEITDEAYRRWDLAKEVL